MKTVKKLDEMRRVKDEEAATMVKNGWVYVCKSEYKAKNGKKTNTTAKKSRVVKTDKKAAPDVVDVVPEDLKQPKVSGVVANIEEKGDRADKKPVGDGLAKYNARKASKKGKR